jgi:hypothetical protein
VYAEKVPGGADAKDGTEAIHVLAQWTAPSGKGYDIEIVLNASVLNSGPGAVSDSAGAIFLTPQDPNDNHAFEGAVSWSGMHHLHSWTLRGTITDTRSGTALGPIYLGLGYKDGTMNQLVVDNLLASSNGLYFLTKEATPQPSKYWDLLPSCTESGPFLPNSLNILQQLPGPVASTILQN